MIRLWWTTRARRTRIGLATALSAVILVAIAATFGPFDITNFAKSRGICGTWACDQQDEFANSSSFFSLTNADPSMWPHGRPQTDD
jgi:hypothetical protein